AGTYYHTAQRDGYLVPFLLAAILGVWRYFDDDTRRAPLVWSGLAAGLGCLFRPTYALLVALGALALVLRRRRTRDVVDAVIFAGLAALPLLAFVATYTMAGHGRALSDLLTFASTVYIALERQTKSVVLARFWDYVPHVIWLGTMLTIIAALR